MEPLTNEQAAEAWGKIAKAHVANVKRAQQEREQLNQALTLASAHAKRKSNTMPLDVARYHQIGHVILQESAALMDLMNLNEKAPPPLTLKPQLEYGSLKIQLLTLELSAIHFDRLHAVLDADLAQALAGQPPAKAMPQAYAAVRPNLKEGTPWGDALKRFHLEQPEFREAVKVLAAGLEDVEALPTPRERLAALRELNVAHASGLHYRLRGLFRLLDGGEAFLEAFAVPKLRPSKARPEAKKGITDRLTGLFKGNG